MGRRVPVLWKLILPLCLVVVLVAASPALGATDALAAPHVAGVPTIDGALDDDHWADRPGETLTFDGTLRDDRTRIVGLRVTHNETHLFFALSYAPGGGTHQDDFVFLTLADGETEDALRHGWAQPTLLDDQHWNGTAWVRDSDHDCALDGEAAREAVDGVWTYEIAKPLAGDGCDIRADAGDTLRVRLEFRENMPGPDHGDNFRWPQGSSSGDTAGWATLRLLVPGGDPASSADPTPSGTTDGRDDGPAGEGESTNGAEGTRGDAHPTGDDQESPAVPFLGVLLATLVLTAGRRSRE